MNNPATDVLRRTSWQELAYVLDLYSDKRDTAIEGMTIERLKRGMHPVRRTIRPAVCITISRNNCEAFERCQASVVADKGYCSYPHLDNCSTSSFVRLEIELDLSQSQQLIQELGLEPNVANDDVAYSEVLLDPNPQLLDCALRCVRLLENPESISTLYPGIMREICYRLLTSRNRDPIIRALTNDSHERRVLKAVRYLREKFNEPIRMEDLASVVAMSPATFHRQFKSVMATTPLQYQKRLRLLEARRRLMAGSSNVESVAIEVGYASASQFFREYMRMFGDSPRRDLTTSNVGRSSPSMFDGLPFIATASRTECSMPEMPVTIAS